MNKGLLDIDKYATAGFEKGSAEKSDNGAHFNGMPQSANPAKNIQVIGSYQFSWGEICERLVGAYFIVWSFNITTRTSDADELQQYRNWIYKILESKFPDHTSEQAVLVAGLYNNWCIYPGTSMETFSIASTLQTEQAARDWISENILKDIIKDIRPSYN